MIQKLKQLLLLASCLVAFNISAASPDFATNPTISSVVSSGNWFAASTWDQNRVPTTDDVVKIESGHVVTYGGTSSADIAAIGIEGELKFSTAMDSSLLVGTIYVNDTGTLRVGDSVNPIPANRSVDITFADRPLYPTSADPITGITDPDQYGIGLVAMGNVYMEGAAIPKTWLRVSVEPLANATTLTLESAPTGWKVGDSIILPDTRQVTMVRKYTNDPVPLVQSQIEERTISAISGNVITLNSALTYDHKGARDHSGTLVKLPHVANLTRNINITSENPSSIRGHTMYSGRGRVEISYVNLTDVGRTTFDAIHNTTYDGNGDVIAVGQNQIARYALHMHFSMGPVNPSNTGYQGFFKGNAVVDPFKIGIDVHGTHWFQVINNVVYGAQGSSFMTELGNERAVEFIDNFAVDVGMRRKSVWEPTYGGVTGYDYQGITRPLAYEDFGYEGTCYWFTGQDLVVTGNVCANAAFAGLMHNPRSPSVFDLHYPVFPNYRGADLADINDPNAWTKTQYVEAAPEIILSDNNETYASAIGMWIWFSTNVGTVDSFTGWHIHQQGIDIQRNFSATLENISLYNDPSVSEASYQPPIGADLRHNSGYPTGQTTINGLTITGFVLGIEMPWIVLTNSPHTLYGTTYNAEIEINDAFLRNQVNIKVESSHGEDRSFTFNNLDVDVTSGGPYSSRLYKTPWNFYSYYAVPYNGVKNLYPTYTYVNGYNGDSVAYKFFFEEQNPDMVMATRQYPSGTNKPEQNCPTLGLTVQECWDTHAVAPLGEPALCNTADALLDGFLCPTGTTPPPSVEVLQSVVDDVLDEVDRLTGISTMTDSEALDFIFDEVESQQ